MYWTQKYLFLFFTLNIVCKISFCLIVTEEEASCTYSQFQFYWKDFAITGLQHSLLPPSLLTIKRAASSFIIFPIYTLHFCLLFIPAPNNPFPWLPLRFKCLLFRGLPPSIAIINFPHLINKILA